MTRTRMLKADVEQLERQIYEVLFKDHPQSVRHVFYRMTDPRLPVSIPKTEAGYIQVQNRMVKMRREGLLPYGWVSDATRRGWHTSTYSSTGDFLQSVADFYRRDLIRGTRLDTGAMLDRLARMEPEDQVPYITDQFADPDPRRGSAPRSHTCPHCGGNLSQESAYRC